MCTGNKFQVDNNVETEKAPKEKLLVMQDDSARQFVLGQRKDLNGR